MTDSITGAPAADTGAAVNGADARAGVSCVNDPPTQRVPGG